MFDYTLRCLSCGAVSTYDFGRDGAVWRCANCEQSDNLELVDCSDSRFSLNSVENFVHEFENDDMISHLILMSDTGLSLDEARVKFIACVDESEFEDYAIETMVGEAALLDSAIRWYLDAERIMSDFEHDYYVVPFDDFGGKYAIYSAA